MCDWLPSVDLLGEGVVLEDMINTWYYVLWWPVFKKIYNNISNTYLRDLSLLIKGKYINNECHWRRCGVASSTSINKLQGMHNAALRTSTWCTQDTNIQHLHDEKNMRHIDTSIVYWHLATRGNNTIMCTPPPH